MGAGTDHARALTSTGSAESKKMGLHVGRFAKDCCRAIVSDATRTKQTAEQVFEHFRPSAVHFEPKLYSANNSNDMAEAITRHVKPSDKTVCVIGHNPILSEMATTLSGQSYNFSPAEFVVLSLDSDSWHTALQSQDCWAPVSEEKSI